MPAAAVQMQYAAALVQRRWAVPAAAAQPQAKVAAKIASYGVACRSMSSPAPSPIAQQQAGENNLADISSGSAITVRRSEKPPRLVMGTRLSASAPKSSKAA